jgi:hypothetical protein
MLYDDRVKETTTTAGTGTINLGGAVASFQAFSTAFLTGTQVPYCLVDGNNWEVGYGTLTTGSPWTLTRDWVMDSSNAGAKITLSGGSTSVFNTVPGDHMDWPTVTNSTNSGDNVFIPLGRQLIVKRQFVNLGVVQVYGELCIL